MSDGNKMKSVAFSEGFKEPIADIAEFFLEVCGSFGYVRMCHGEGDGIFL